MAEWSHHTLSMAHLCVLAVQSCLGNCKLLRQCLQIWANQKKTPDHAIKVKLRVCERCVDHWGFLVCQGGDEGTEQGWQPGEPSYYF